MEKKIIQLVLSVIVIAFSVVIVFNLFNYTTDAIAVKSADTDTSLEGSSGEKKDVEIRKKINPSRVLGRIDEGDYTNAMIFYTEDKEKWLECNPQDADLLIRYLDDYFELKYALDYCIENEINFDKVNKYMEKDNSKKLEKMQKKVEMKYNSNLAKIESDGLEKNPYLRGEKDFEKGSSAFFRNIGNLSTYMSLNADIHAEIPAYDICRTIYRYDSLKKASVTNFEQLMNDYERYVIQNSHNGKLTRNDATILCLRAYYLLLELSDTKEDVRKKKCTNLYGIIEKSFDSYKEYIGPKGNFSKEHDYLKRIQEYTNEISAADRRKSKKMKKDVPSLFEKIPNLY